MRSLKFAQSFEVVAELPEHLRDLHVLARNFRWCWNQEAQQVFLEVDPQLWEAVEHNPVLLIRRLTPERQARLAADPLFLNKLKVAVDDLNRYLDAETWFDREFPGERESTRIAYFCAEFGLNECMPIYSGGLGVLAGDHLKAASDLGIPLVGVGLLYSRGYFRQLLSEDGWQTENYPQVDFFSLPISLVRREDGHPLTVVVEFPDRNVTVQVWECQVGRIKLYLLDSNILANQPVDQGITDTLYGGDEHMRIRQEMVLGVGGLAALEALGLQPTVCHMNEGHAAFLTVERLIQFMEQHRCDLKTARQVTVAGNVFTTHTPVPAGFDFFRPELLRQYMGKKLMEAGLDFADFLEYGRVNPENKDELFNMAVLAMTGANYVNGVSRLHAEVSRGMFADRWDEFPIQEVPIDAVTNGIHTSSWLGHRMAQLMDRHLGPAWRDDPADAEVWRQAAEIPLEDLWEMREASRADLVRFVRRKSMRLLQRRNASRQELSSAGSVLDPRVLTIGFARRFATYKRASLLFSDKDRLRHILHNSERPVQFVFSGKSHPKDDGGKKLIQDIVHFVKHEGAKGRVVFIEDYDMETARYMIQGVDVWLNNPRRPMEASGTSGMKVVPNGGLNCSVLDGWWAEGYAPGNGWAIGDGLEDPDHGRQDWHDSRALYQLIEQDLAPLFYHRDENGIPVGWLQMVRQSMRELAPRFSTARMVREYTTRFYMPASTAYQRLQSEGLNPAREALAWRRRVRDAWPNVRVTSVTDNTRTQTKLGENLAVEAWVELGSLSSSDVRVQLLVGKVGPNRDLVEYAVKEMVFEDGRYKLEIPCPRPGHMGYIVRVVPEHANVRVAHELPLATYQVAES